MMNRDRTHHQPEAEEAAHLMAAGKMCLAFCLRIGKVVVALTVVMVGAPCVVDCDSGDGVDNQ
jgi:uncharacterized membrane protein